MLVLAKLFSKKLHKERNYTRNNVTKYKKGLGRGVFLEPFFSEVNPFSDVMNGGI